MRHCPFCDKKCVNFGIKLDAEISIWMQSGFDGFDFSATLLLCVTVYFETHGAIQSKWENLKLKSHKL